MRFLPFLLILLTSMFCQSALAADEAPLKSPSQKIVLSVSGDITHTNKGPKAVFDWPMLKALPQHQITTSTSVTDGKQTFTGFYLSDLLNKVGAKGDHVLATALNDYRVSIPIDDFKRFNVIAAYSMNGKQLTPSDKGPLWIVYPRSDYQKLQDIRYDYRWVWQLIKLKVTP